ncbi:MAG: 30S ribosomal protein S13 [Patescibacteria group bacterium]
MARIAGVNIDDKKRLIAGLCYIYGIGPARAAEICQKTKLTANPHFSELTDQQLDAIRQLVEKQYTVETDLRTQVASNIRRLKEISCYRGLRHIRNLPVHGQRTKTNARTKRGKRVTVGSGRKKSSEKT